MPSIGFSEIVIILIVALIVFGPKRLPEVGRSVGRALREFKKTSDDVRNEFASVLDEEEPTVPGALPTAAAPDPDDGESVVPAPDPVVPAPADTASNGD